MARGLLKGSVGWSTPTTPGHGPGSGIGSTEVSLQFPVSDRTGSKACSAAAATDAAPADALSAPAQVASSNHHLKFRPLTAPPHFCARVLLRATNHKEPLRLCQGTELACVQGKRDCDRPEPGRSQFEID